MVKISIITVVYNGERWLEQAIQSVLDQNYPALEYIVVDGASTDGTLAIIGKYEDRISRLISEPDYGMYHAINKGIGLCGGELIGILNSDDWLEPDALASLQELWRENPSADVYHGIVTVTDERGIPQRKMECRVDYLDTGMIGHPACFISKEAYQKFGMYDLSYQSAADYELMLRFRKAAARFIFTEKTLANFRSHISGKSNSVAAALETIAIRYRYGLISWFRMSVLWTYWKLLK